MRRAGPVRPLPLVFGIAVVLGLAGALCGSHSLGWNSSSVPVRAGREEIGGPHLPQYVDVSAIPASAAVAQGRSRPLPGRPRPLRAAQGRRRASSQAGVPSGPPGSGGPGRSSSEGGAAAEGSMSDADGSVWPDAVDPGGAQPRWEFPLGEVTGSGGASSAEPRGALGLPAPTISSGPAEAMRFLQQVRLCYWRLRALLDARPRGGDLTDRQWLLLRTLNERGPLTARIIGEALAVRPPSVSALLWRLEDRGLLQRQPSPVDRRAVVVSITEEGARIVLLHGVAPDLRLESALASLPAARRRLLLESLERVVRALEAGPREADAVGDPRSAWRPELSQGPAAPLPGLADVRPPLDEGAPTEPPSPWVRGTPSHRGSAERAGHG